LAVKKIEEIVAPKLIGQKIDNQKAIDEILDSLAVSFKSLPRSALFTVSSACAILGAKVSKKELFVYLNEQFSFGEIKIPVPIFNIFNGGDTGDTSLDFQEFLLIPKKGKAADMVRLGAEVFVELGDVLKESSYDTDTGSEGGYAPDIDSTIEAIELLMSAIIRSGYEPGRDFTLGIDIGSSIFYNENEAKYVFSLDHSYFHSSDLTGLYNEWLRKYPLSYLEDPFNEKDWRSWRELTADLGRDILIAGDDVFSSDINRFRESLKERIANTIIIKPSQAGTLTTMAACAKLARERNYKLVVSARSRETMDTLIVDLAVACGADYLKAGSLSRGERVTKYNRLMEIGQMIGK
jgi:enolase